MFQYVKKFSELTKDDMAYAGGKGSNLARLYQSGYPVPEGFVIMPGAFLEDKLAEEAWLRVKENLDDIRARDKDAAFAVRSSALSEDSAGASFAGEFETVLNISDDSGILDAIYKVHYSKSSERVKAYSKVQGMDIEHEIAIVVQKMVRPEIAGVIFTADPISGSLTVMSGNYVQGFGEQLVSGETNAFEFKLKRPKGGYEGPAEFKKYSGKLYKIVRSVEAMMGCPQDIEWAAAGGRIYLLQSRPITTLKGLNAETGEWNDSLIGDFLWSNTNSGEAVPDVMTPLTWTLLKSFHKESDIFPGSYPMTGNICGRVYANISLIVSLYPAFGMSYKHAFKKFGDLIGEIPEGIDIPLVPFSGIELLSGMIPRFSRQLKKFKEANKKIKAYFEESPKWCTDMIKKLDDINEKPELLSIWERALKPRYFDAQWMMRSAASSFSRPVFSLSKKLTKLIGKEDSNTLLSNLSGGSSLASLGPVVGLSKVSKGEIGEDEYMREYGHRSPHEMELSIKRPYEDKEWLKKHVEEFKSSNIDVAVLMEKQHKRFEDTWKRLKQGSPSRAKAIVHKLKKASDYAHLRETARSEFVRVIGVVRRFALKAGDMTGLGEDVFYLYLDELIDVLNGRKESLKFIEKRKRTHEKYCALPPYPAIVCGRFDPISWAKDPGRRSDVFSSHTIGEPILSNCIKGYAGAAGQIEGIVRRLDNPEEGFKLKIGEILVTTTTNVGWTPIFPRTGAIITDVGAPLSHAAIVARELGIPAVVGCGNATTLLKTGDRVLVDGGQGTVKILEKNN